MMVSVIRECDDAMRHTLGTSQQGDPCEPAGPTTVDASAEPRHDPGASDTEIRIGNTSPTDFHPIENLQMMRFTGEKWEWLGALLDGRAERAMPLRDQRAKRPV